jgi:hypothetical protein
MSGNSGRGVAGQKMKPLHDARTQDEQEGSHDQSEVARSQPSRSRPVDTRRGSRHNIAFEGRL